MLFECFCLFHQTVKQSVNKTIFDMNIYICVPTQTILLTDCCFANLLLLFKKYVFHHFIRWESSQTKRRGSVGEDAHIVTSPFQDNRASLPLLACYILLFIHSLFFRKPNCNIIITSIRRKKTPFMLNRDGIHDQCLSSYF